MEDAKNAITSDSLGSSMPTTVAVIAVTILIYLVYILRWKPHVKEVPDRRALLLRDLRISRSPKDSEQYAYCKSPECVRCQKYKIVKAEAQKRLLKFKALNEDSGLDRIHASLHDVKSLPSDPLQDPNVLYVPGLRSNPFWNGSNEFAHEMKLFERQWGLISREFESVFSNRCGSWFRNNTETGSWSVFYFYNQGLRIRENCRRCPQTVALVESLASFMRLNIFGNAFFSVLDSGTRVAEHCGPCNIRIRCHLGLSVPAKTTITVGGETKSYNLGCCVYFDDSFVHSTANADSSVSEPRAVLLLDLWHPDLTFKERDALNFVFPPTSGN